MSTFGQREVRALGRTEGPEAAVDGAATGDGELDGVAYAQYAQG